MPIFEPTESNIAAALELLDRGECVGLPTETVYGLAADGFNPDALARIFEIKRRPFFDPLILHIADPERLGDVAAEVSPIAAECVKRFWPGPLTLLLPKRDVVPDIATSGLPTVAVRCPEHPLARRVLAARRTPLAAPSANRFGRISPTTAVAVHMELGDEVTIILDGGPCLRGLESTILDCTGEVPRIARPGALERERIEAVTGPLEVMVNQGPPTAPGMLKSHYAPRTTLYLSRDSWQPGMAKLAGNRHVYLLLKHGGSPQRDVIELASDGSMITAGAALFASMRRADERRPQSIIAFLVSPEGLGLAINDRLKKASSGWVTWRNGDWTLCA